MFLSLRHTNQLRPGPSGIFFLSTIFPCRGRRTKMCLDRCFRLIFIPDQANCSRNVSGKRILRYYFFLTCSPPPQKCRDQEPRSPTPSTGRPPLTTAAAKTEMRGLGCGGAQYISFLTFALCGRNEKNEWYRNKS